MTRSPDLQLGTDNSQSSWKRNLRGAAELLGVRPGWWWTGKPPEQCPGYSASGKLHSLPPPDLASCTRAELLDYFDNSWTLTELLFSALEGEEAFFRPPYHRLRHPMVFYYAHPAALYINKLRVAGLIHEPLNLYYEQLFETGVDEMSWDDLSKSDLEWPTIREINEYRRAVYATVRGTIETHPSFDERPLDRRGPAWAAIMGCEHERIHLELSAVLLRELPLHLLRRPGEWPDPHPSVARPGAHPPLPGVAFPANELLPVRGGDVVVGKPPDWPSYGWDNEYGDRHFSVPPFRAGRFLVSNGEFWEFVDRGGYQTAQNWTEEGWRWRTFRNAKWPTFWMPNGPVGLHRYRLRLLFELVDMPWSCPVEVNYHEAKAFCAWKTERENLPVPLRLVTEPEHHRLWPRPSRDVSTATRHTDSPERCGLNLNLAYGSESSVDALPATPDGFHDVFGNVWEWCEDHFAALPGFEVHGLYDDFSTPCFDGKHNLILGGSFVSTGAEASVWARFHFRRHFFQHAGFRVVQPGSMDAPLVRSCVDAPPPHVGIGPCCSANPAGVHGNLYEGRAALNEYLLLHYGDPEEITSYRFISKDVLQFPRRCAELLIRTAERLGLPRRRALDVGCAVGGATFALAQAYEQVLGIDLSERFITSARTLQGEGRLSYERRDEGDLVRPIIAQVEAAIDRDRVAFRQGDACSLPADLGAFDAVLMANLLCRVPSPRSCLARMVGPRSLVAEGALLLITTPCTWMEEYTPRSAWLGGLVRDGVEVRTLDGLHEQLDADFELLEVLDLPLVIREHERKFQYIVSQASIWHHRS